MKEIIVNSRESVYPEWRCGMARDLGMTNNDLIGIFCHSNFIRLCVSLKHRVQLNERSSFASGEIILSW